MSIVLRVLRSACLALACTWAGAEAPNLAPQKTVVILHSLPIDLPGYGLLSKALSEGLRKDLGQSVEIYSEYTGLDRFSGPAYDASLLNFYREKFARRKVDLLVVVGPSALEFVVAKRFLPEVPVVTCYTAQRFVESARAQRPNLTGALSARNAPKTIELMLRLYPATRRIHVVLGASDYERGQAEQGQKIFASFLDRVSFDYLNALSLEQIEARVAQLKEDELVLFGSLIQDAAGRSFTSDEPLIRISKASQRPIFGVLVEDLGAGIVGGVLLSMELSGAAAADLGRRILNGESAASIPLVPDTGAAPMFDWRELQRWGLREGRLPAGSLVQFRKVGLWEAYWKEISLGLGVMVLEGFLVAGLVVQLRRRKRTERALAEAERRYRTVADFTHDWEFWQRADGTFEYISPACEGITGYTPQELLQDPALLRGMVEPESLSAWLGHQEAVLSGQARAALQYRLRSRSGELKWVEQDDNPVVLPGGSPGGNRGSIRDITDRKQTELDLRQAYQEIGALKDRLEAENSYYREKIQAVEPSSELLGESDAMKYLLHRIRQVAPSETTVLIQGETGTGKELVAESVHRIGPRKERPLIKVNCAALPQGLAESELFGHERGAFTGAQAQRKGRFELADGATLFLDEVGELSPEIQAKLLRVLQNGEFQRVGGVATLKVDVRLIAATNRDLGQEVAKGRFREDLWYRLNVFPITVPPLRQRPDDIPILTQAFVDRFCLKLGRPILKIPTSVLRALQAYPWPGNVRELQNVLERAVLVSEGKDLRLAESLVPPPRLEPGAGEPMALEAVERGHILKVLNATGWRVEGATGAAALLGLKPSTLRSRMAKLEIAREG